jgi:myo-inositol-1(or 4)-monophosphatase
MDVNDIRTIAREAGEIVRDGFGSGFGVELKSNKNDLVTDVDKRSEKAIVDFIGKKYPEHGVLAEEGSSRNRDAEYVWVIDPIDGTTNFAHGLPLFSISIGVRRNDETIAGAVYDVMRDALYFAEKGSGAFKNDERVRASDQPRLADALVVTGFPYNIADNPRKTLELFTEFTLAARGVRRLGSAAIDFCYVAEGVFDGFWEINLNPWDVCAGRLLVEEAGGRVTDYRGEPNDIYDREVLATNGAVHEDMTALIARVDPWSG